MAHTGINIQQIDVAGVFNKVQQAKSNALTLERQEFELSAFRQNEEQQKQLGDVRRRAVGGDQGAIEALAAAGEVGEAMDIVTLSADLDAVQRQNLEDGALEMARFGTEFLDASPENRPAIIQNMKDRFPDLAEQIPDNPTDEQARAFVTRAQSAATLASIVNPDKRTPNLIAIGSLDENGRLISEQIIDMNNHPDPVGVLNQAAQQGKAIFDPETAAAGQKVGTPLASEQAELRADLRSSAALFTSVDRLIELIDEGGAGITGPVGFLQRAADTIEEQVVAAADAFGFSEAETAGDININGLDFSAFGDAAALSAAFKSVAARTAFLIAESNDPGARKTNEDIQRAFDQMGIGSGSSNQIRAALGEVRRFESQRVQNRINQANQPGLTVESFSRDFGVDLGAVDGGNIVIEGHPRLGNITQQMIQDEAQRTGLSEEEIIRRLEQEGG